jgi:TRAP transporter TAXI family solute receptor
MRHPLLVIMTALLSLAGLVALGFYISTRPTTLRVAVGPLGNENVRTITAAIQTLQREREPFRLKLVITTGSQQTGEFLDTGKVDLAVIRPDALLPRNGATVAIMYSEEAVLIAPGTSGLESAVNLKGKTVAVLRDGPGNLRILEIIAAQAGLSPGDIIADKTRIANLRPALESGKVHAVLVVGYSSSKLVTDIVNMVTDVGQGKINFIPIPEVSAIEQRYPLLESGNIVRGLYGGRTPRPEADVPTLVVSHHLLASKSLADTIVSDFTRVLLTSKSQIASEAPLAARMEAPDQEKASPIPIHPGTITYLDGQTTTFIERYGDWFYIGIMGLGFVATAFAGYMGVAASRAKKKLMGMLQALQSLVSEVSQTNDIDGLDALTTRADGIFHQTMSQALEDNVDPASMMAFNMAFTQFNKSVNARRRSLETALSSPKN